jgi:hypothetical protein
MDGIAIGLGLLIAVSVVVFVSWPWWARRGALQLEGGSNVSPRERLAERREAVLAALRDLDFDRAVGKVTEEDHGLLRQALLAEAAEATAQLDEEQAEDTADLDARIEMEVLAARQALHAEREGMPLAVESACPACGRLSRPGDWYCSGCGTQLQAGCPSCGGVIHPTDLFCIACGAELAPAVS